ncbi:hypothetical protein E1091_01130 [Micromonospora fluostatini]|uniref:Phage tail assembly protein n=1 Tax=Micromonospora fluostatini TaxID=1629071 RepID=A0ABY2DLQ4_9ACTN|nr:hypothetical protein E1091_01130 [Micromonospora fluostatini]
MARFTAAKLQQRAQAKRTVEPFEYELEDGRVLRFADPKGLHLKTLKELRGGDIHDNLLALLGQESYDLLMAQPEVDIYFVEALLEEYNTHHGVAEQGE